MKQKVLRALAAGLLTMLALNVSAGWSFADMFTKSVYCTNFSESGVKLMTKVSAFSYQGKTSLSQISSSAPTYYWVSSNCTVSDRITVSGNVVLILADGVTLTASKGITVESGNLLTITVGGTSSSFNGTGKLTATSSTSASGIGGDALESAGTVNIYGGEVKATSSEAAGIGGGGLYGYGTVGGSGGTVAIYGGKVTAISEAYGAGIGGGYKGSGGTVNIYGGEVSASSYNGAGIGGGIYGSGGTVNITGGTVTAKGESYGAGIGGGMFGSGGTVNITGGTVTVTGGYEASGIGAGNVGSGCTLTISGKADVTVESPTSGYYALNCDYATAAAAVEGYVRIVQDKDGNIFDSTSTTEAVDLIDLGLTKSKQYAHIFLGSDYTVTFYANGGEGTMDKVSVKTGGTISTINKFKKAGYAFIGWNTKADGTGTAYAASSNTAFTSDITLYAQWRECAYYYTDSKGDVQGLTSSQFTTLSAGRVTSTKALESGYWVVKDSIVSTVRLYVNKNNVTLILNDSATFDASAGGIEVLEGGTLTITTGNTTEDIEGTGRLIAIGGKEQSGIGSGELSPNGTVNICGGIITATGNRSGAGIGGGKDGGGGTVNIYGGTVSATGGDDASAIGGGNGGGAGNISISGTADVTVKSSADGVYALHCSPATATPAESYICSVQDENGNNLDGTPTPEEVNLIDLGLTDNLQYAHIFLTTGYAVKFDANGGEGTMKSVGAEIGGTVSTVNKFKRAGYAFVEWNTKADGTGTAYEESSNAAFVSDITLYAQWKEFACFYTDSTGKAQSLADEKVNILTTERATSKDTLESGYWVVKGDVASTVRLYVDKNNVTLILYDSATLNASKGGIEVSEGGTLTITSGNYTENIAGTGKLIANGELNQSGIGGSDNKSNGTVNIYGGNVTATGGASGGGYGRGASGAAGIGGGISGGGGIVNIIGGTVMATGGGRVGCAFGAGNSGSGGTFTISGKADVTLKSQQGYILGCTTVTAYTDKEGYSVFVQDKDGKNLDGTPSTGTVNLIDLGLNKKLQYAHIFFAETPKVEVAIGETGWASLYYGDYNLEIPDGVKAYIVTAADTADCTLTKTEVTGVIPAGTAVLLWDNDTTKANTYSFYITTENNSADLSDNILRGYDVDSLTTADDYGTTEGYYFYKLSRNEAGDNNSVGFYWDVEGGAAFTNPAHKAFMVLAKAASGGAKAFLLNGGDASGINGIESAANANGKIYDVSGRNHGTDANRLSKGIYIRNGKKFVVK